jgi:hypothetical protein
MHPHPRGRGASQAEAMEVPNVYQVGYDPLPYFSDRW